jgi:hypothetical protein
LPEPIEPTVQAAHVENHTARVIKLPPTDSFPRGMPLPPGYWRVDGLYWSELMALECLTEPKPGKKALTRYPGRDQIEQLKVPVSIVSKDGVTFGPQITIYEKDQVGRDAGPPPPMSLKGLKPEAAQALIRVTTDRNALKRWAGEKSDYSTQAQHRLMGGSGL